MNSELVTVPDILVSYSSRSQKQTFGETKQPFPRSLGCLPRLMMLIAHPECQTGLLDRIRNSPGRTKVSLVVIYHAGTPQNTSGTALDSPGQLVAGLDTSCLWITVPLLLFSPVNHILKFLKSFNIYILKFYSILTL